MTNTQFKYLRFLSLPLAIFFVVQWWELPGKLERGSSNVVTVSAIYSSYKGGQAMLIEPNGESLVIWCHQARSLCRTLEVQSIANLRIWFVRPTLLHRARLIAAEEDGKIHLSETQTNSALRQAKLIQGALALLFSAIAGAMWYFAPFTMLARKTNAA